MEKPNVTLTLPADVYRRFQRAARETNQPLDKVLLQSIRGNLPPIFDDIPVELREEIRGMARFTDDELWAIAQRPQNQRAWRKHQLLLELNAARDLTESEKRELEQLRGGLDKYVLKKSFALALLKWRGYTIPAHHSSRHAAP